MKGGEKVNTTTQSLMRAVVRFCVLIVLSGTFGLVIAEVFARMFMPEWAPATGQITKFWQHDSILGWAHVPGVEGIFASTGFKTNVKINSVGFRDKEVEFERQMGRTRVLVLGDSLVWGFGVNAEDTVTSKLEAKVSNLETINLAVSGYRQRAVETGFSARRHWKYQQVAMSTGIHPAIHRQDASHRANSGRRTSGPRGH